MYLRAGVIKIFVWLITFTVLFFYHRLFSFDDLVVSSFVLALIDLGALLLSALFINRYLIPQLLYKKHTLLFALLLASGFIVVSLVIQQAELIWFNCIQTLSSDSRSVFYSFSYQLFNTYMVQFLGSLGICTVRVVNDQKTVQIKYEILQKEKAQTELNFLKAQINPHFLFNSINSLYAEIEKTNTSARNIVLQFSEMLRYQLYECNVEEIEIEKEIEYLRNYIGLEILRKGDYLRVNFETKGEMYGFKIAPLLFITFIENAFKYASSHDDKPNTIEIRLERKGQILNFQSVNTKDSIASRSLVEDHGIGIKNVKRRLELLYPGKHDLAITDDENSFGVHLKILLT